MNTTTRLLMFALIIAAAASLMVGASTFIEQVVKAQNMTTNMTGDNMSGSDNASGDISSFKGGRVRTP